jgi:hypothetical protein
MEKKTREGGWLPLDHLDLVLFCKSNLVFCWTSRYVLDQLHKRRVKSYKVRVRLGWVVLRSIACMEGPRL